MSVSERQKAAIGRRRNEVETPALILDLDAARANIATMAEKVAALPAALRPHAKLHKSPKIAQMQVDAGAIGIATATIREAIAMANAGIDDILIANEVVGPDKVAALAEVARSTRITVAVDSPANLDQLSAAASAAASTIGVIVEVDVGMGRCGVRSKEEALEVARHARGLPGIEWRGAMGYEGHCMLEPDREIRVQKQGKAVNDLLAVVDHLAADGIDCEIISAGGTGTYDLTGAHPRVTELQAGSYVFMDAFHGSLIPGFPPALTVLATVVSRHGPRVVLDAGRKAVGADLMMPVAVGLRGRDGVPRRGAHRARRRRGLHARGRRHGRADARLRAHRGQPPPHLPRRRERGRHRRLARAGPPRQRRPDRKRSRA